MSGTSELAALERRVTRIADQLMAAQSLISNLTVRTEAIEEALQLRTQAKALPPQIKNTTPPAAARRRS